MKKILAILFSGVLLAGLPSCGDFLEEYSQTLSYVDDLSDLDELLIGGAYLEDRSQVCGLIIWTTTARRSGSDLTRETVP